MMPEQITQQAEETEEELFARCRAALSDSDWTTGECASKWTEKFSRGRTDEDFGRRVGLSGEQVRQRRTVWERFGSSNSNWKVSFTHHYTAMNWPDCEDALTWAEDTGATVAEMKAWHRARNGEDLTQPEADPVTTPTITAPEPDEPIWKPAENPQAPKKTQPAATSTKATKTEKGPRKAPKNKPDPHAVIPVVPIADQITLKAGIDMVAKTIRKLSAVTDMKQRRRGAQKLRKLADEMDPPATDIPPRIEDVAAYCAENAPDVCPHKFWFFYDQKGWTVDREGKQIMRKWTSAVMRAQHEGYFKGTASNGQPGDNSYGSVPF